MLKAIEHADLCLLAPGSLFTSVLAASAAPDVASALAHTAARVVWICNLKPDAIETAGMRASDHLGALRRHGVRVDAALYDPRAELHFDAAELAGERVEALGILQRDSRLIDFLMEDIASYSDEQVGAAVRELLAEPNKAGVRQTGSETMATT